MSELNLGSLDPISVQVNIGGKKYTLYEASLGTGIKHRDAMMTSSVFQDGKIVGMKGTSHIEPLIISECLYDENGKLVPVGTVKEWPDRITSVLYAKIREISGFEREESVASLEDRLAKAKAQEDAAKNESSSMPDAAD